MKRKRIERKKLVLVDLSSPEVDLANWRPNSRSDVLLKLDMEIGFSEGITGVNMFYATLATPEALRERRTGIVLVRNRTIVVSEYDYDAIRECILEILEASTRSSYEESCKVLQRYFEWEYEDYK